jgi:hypothetical protein
LLTNLAVDAADELDVVWIGDVRDGNEVANGAGRVEAFGQLPWMSLGLQLVLLKIVVIEINFVSIF